jgi:hypothetical protein
MGACGGGEGKGKVQGERAVGFAGSALHLAAPNRNGDILLSRTCTFKVQVAGFNIQLLELVKFNCRIDILAL